MIFSTSNQETEISTEKQEVYFKKSDVVGIFSDLHPLDYNGKAYLAQIMELQTYSPKSNDNSAETNHNSADLISRKAVLDFTTEWCNRCGKRKEYDGVLCKCCDLEDTIDFVEELPTIPQTDSVNEEELKKIKEKVLDILETYKLGESKIAEEVNKLQPIYINVEKQTDSVLEDIKAEIENEMSNAKSTGYLNGLNMALMIINEKHISRKE